MSANPLYLTRYESDLSPHALAVRTALVDASLETPMVDNGLSEPQKYERIKASMTDVLRTLGLDSDRR